jgi:DNA polymerase-1
VWLPAAVIRGTVAEALASLVSSVGRPIAAHDAKELIRGLWAHFVDLTGLAIDTAVAAYLLDPADSRYDLAELAERRLGLELRSPDAPDAGQLDLDGSAEPESDRAAREAVAVARLAEWLSDALDQQGLSRLHDEIERPLVRVLARMEEVGIAVDVTYLNELNDGLVADAEKLRLEICELAGEDFNVNSTPQLREVLFDRLGLAPQKKTKTGFSTDAQSLEKLRDQHPIVEALLRYREVEKLRSTYGEGLVAEVADDGRIHATFNQTVARTGRLSSDRPNLHNIPVRTEEGRRFRRAFVPAEGFDLLVADYNQIELRVIAHLAEDPGLIEAFRTGQDVHTTTAARIFGVAPADVSIGQRSKAKMVSYGLAYGMEAYGLAQRLSIPVGEAAEILDAYFVAFPNVRSYMERVVAETRERGYTETLFGRRRPIPELQSTNHRIRQAGERQAMNAGIQGLAADIFKVALVRLDQALEEKGVQSRLVLQVHDEVILEVPPAEHDAMAALTVECMAGAAELCVPLEVNVSWGASWADAKG